MPEVLQRIRKVGGSLMVRIPKELADQYSFKAGELISINPKRGTTDYCGAFPGGKGWVKPDASFYSKHL